MKNKEYYIRLGEAVQKLEEKNCPTDPSKWSYYKSQAKEKFDVYPSAYANGWASKQYGDAGGGWKKCENETVNEKFDKTHLGILKYAYKDIDKINPSDPMYVRVAQMLDKLSKQELQQLIDADIKFISLLAKNRLTKKESIDEGLYQDIMRGVKKGDSPFTLVVIKNNKVVKQVEVKTGQAIPANYSLLLKEFPNSRIRIEDATGKIVMGESVNESSMSNIDIIAQEAKDFKDFVKEFYNEYKDFPKDRDTIKWLKGVYDNRSTSESVVNEGNSSVEIGDIIFFPPANSAATVIDRFGRSVTLKLANGKKVKTVVDKVKLLAQDNVNEGNAFTGALFNARKEGLTEFEFNGKKYPVHKLEEEEKEETLAESKLTKDSLKQIIKEEYHNVKTFMEEKYGFTAELGKVYSNLAAKPFLKEEEEEVVDEYDVENYQDLTEFVQFMAEFKSDINEAEYQGRKVKLGKIMQGDAKKFKVYVKNDKGNVVKVNFGQGGDAKGGTMRIRKDNPEARASFRARHNCDTPGPRWKARYWSCRKW